MIRTDIRQHSRTASSGIKTLAVTARQSVGDQLRALKESLPAAFQALPPAERHNVIEELRSGLIIWTDEIDVVRGDLRALLRQLQYEVQD